MSKVVDGTVHFSAMADPLGVPILVQMGGIQTLEKMVPLFYEQVTKDPILGPFFTSIPKEKLNKLQIHFLTKLLNGGTGLSKEVRNGMIRGHANLGLNDSHFDLMEKYFEETALSIGLDPTIVLLFMEKIGSSRPLILGYKTTIKTVVIDEVGNEKTIVIVDGKDKDLYAAIGGQYTINLIAQKMYSLVLKDPELKNIFEGKNVNRILVAFSKYFAGILSNTLSPDMRSRMQFAHQRIHLSNHHFDLFAHFFGKALLHFEIDPEVASRLSLKLECCRPDIIPPDQYFKGYSNLYEHVGGDLTMDLVVENFLRLVSSNATIAPYFTGIDLFKQALVQKRFLKTALQEKELTPGTISIMRNAHKGMDLDDHDFDEFKGVMKESFRGLNLMNDELLEEITSRIESHRGFIVSSPEETETS